MAHYKDVLRCVTWIAVLTLFEACENPTENMNTVWDPPSEWYGFPTWSPTGEWIAYEYYGPDGPWGIWLVRPDGSENHFETEGFLADFSSDGYEISFCEWRKDFCLRFWN